MDNVETVKIVNCCELDDFSFMYHIVLADGATRDIADNATFREKSADTGLVGRISGFSLSLYRPTLATGNLPSIMSFQTLEQEKKHACILGI